MLNRWDFVRKAIYGLFVPLITASISCYGNKRGLPFLPRGVYFPLSPKFSLEKNFKSSNEKKWEDAIASSKMWWEKSCELLDRNTRFLYGLLILPTLSPLLPLIENPSLQRYMLICAVKRGKFIKRKIAEDQCKKINKIWKELAIGEKFLFKAHLVIAHLREKWPAWTLFPHVPKEGNFPHIASLLLSLPTVEEIEKKREKIEELMQLCRQLLVSNSSISPPPEIIQTLKNQRGKR